MEEEVAHLPGRSTLADEIPSLKTSLFRDSYLFYIPGWSPSHNNAPASASHDAGFKGECNHG